MNKKQGLSIVLVGALVMFTALAQDEYKSPAHMLKSELKAINSSKFKEIDSSEYKKKSEVFNLIYHELITASKSDKNTFNKILTEYQKVYEFVNRPKDKFKVYSSLHEAEQATKLNNRYFMKIRLVKAIIQEKYLSVGDTLGYDQDEMLVDAILLKERVPSS